MTTYKELKGTNIQAVSSDPSNPIEGQVWYNTTDNVLKGLALTGAAAWASGGATNQVRSQAATFVLNRTKYSNDANTATAQAQGVSSITLMEVSA